MDEERESEKEMMDAAAYYELSYWYSRCPHNSDAYSIRTKTKREALAKLIS